MIQTEQGHLEVPVILNRDETIITEPPPRLFLSGALPPTI